MLAIIIQIATYTAPLHQCSTPCELRDSTCTTSSKPTENKVSSFFPITIQIYSMFIRSVTYLPTQKRHFFTANFFLRPQSVLHVKAQNFNQNFDMLLLSLIFNTWFLVTNLRNSKYMACQVSVTTKKKICHFEWLVYYYC